ncbi:hypothetical protein [Pedobacter sp. Hv1]|uniref:hypothetical protein n=1 Tax=Pedobacter sp. Hv1 TaxID=1740090 RepID=UPI0006D88CE5|nr:hypothetical protein [Pedobacter sp. Hv1]KQC00709.1 hypothetical protein AQF98_08495 [Pedobacter sp. Hv1]
MNFKKIKSIFVFALLIICFYPFLRECNRRDSLRNDKTKIVKAIVTSEKHILANSRVTFPFTYGYEFYIDGKKYEGDTHNESYSPGDYILIEYVDGKPEYNSPRGYYK